MIPLIVEFTTKGLRQIIHKGPTYIVVFVVVVEIIIVVVVVVVVGAPPLTNYVG